MMFAIMWLQHSPAISYEQEGKYDATYSHIGCQNSLYNLVQCAQHIRDRINAAF